MRLDNEVADFIEEVLSKYLDKDEISKAFSPCYITVMTALDKNSDVINKWAYIRTIVMNCLTDYVDKAYLERKEN